MKVFKDYLRKNKISLSAIGKLKLPLTKNSKQLIILLQKFSIPLTLSCVLWSLTTPQEIVSPAIQVLDLNQGVSCGN